MFIVLLPVCLDVQQHGSAACSSKKLTGALSSSFESAASRGLLADHTPQCDQRK